MKHTIRLFILTMMLALIPQGLLAQVATTQTVITSAMSATATTMVVGSNTGFVASTGTATYFAYLGQELVKVTGVSGTTITVQRGGQNGTIQSAHPVNEIVFTYSTAPTTTWPFQNQDPKGSCTRTLQVAQPIINIRNGNIWDCDAINGVWESVNLTQSASSMPFRTFVDNGATTAYTAGLYDTYISIPITSAAFTLTLPAVTGIYGKVMIVRPNNRTVVPNITIQGSASQGVGTSATGTTLAVLTQGFTVRLIAVGGSWETW